MIVQRMNPLTGHPELIVDSNDHKDDGSSMLAHASSHLDMLNDYPRNHAFFTAIHAQCNHIITKRSHQPFSLPQFRFVDIGTGTGLLALFVDNAVCSTHGIEASGHLYECVPALAQLAKTIVHEQRSNANLLTFTVHQRRSDDDHQLGGNDAPDQCANLAVMEIFDSALLGEGVLPVVRHLHRSLLCQDSDSAVVPARATVYAQLAGGHTLAQLAGTSELEKASIGTTTVLPTYETSADQISDLIWLSDASPVLQFAFNDPTSLPEGCEHQCGSWKQSRALCGGTAFVIVMWFTLDLCDDSSVTYTTCPGQRQQWSHHWKQVVHFLERPIEVHDRSLVLLQALHDDFSMWFRASTEISFTEPSDGVNDVPGVQTWLVNGYGSRRELLLRCTSHEYLNTVIASVQRLKGEVRLGEYGAVSDQKDQEEQRVLLARGVDPDARHTIESVCDYVIEDRTERCNASLVLPHFAETITMGPIASLVRTWAELSAIAKGGVHAIAPRHARIVAALASVPDLARCCKALRSDDMPGCIDVSKANEVVLPAEGEAMVYPLWQCAGGYVLCSEPMEMLALNLAEIEPEEAANETGVLLAYASVEPSAVRACDCIVAWVEYYHAKPEEGGREVEGERPLLMVSSEPRARGEVTAESQVVVPVRSCGGGERVLMEVSVKTGGVKAWVE